MGSFLIFVASLVASAFCCVSEQKLLTLSAKSRSRALLQAFSIGSYFPEDLSEMG